MKQIFSKNLIYYILIIGLILSIPYSLFSIFRKIYEFKYYIGYARTAIIIITDTIFDNLAIISINILLLSLLKSLKKYDYFTNQNAVIVKRIALIIITFSILKDLL